jgi:hypothetical protein
MVDRLVPSNLRLTRSNDGRHAHKHHHFQIDYAPLHSRVLNGCRTSSDVQLAENAQLSSPGDPYGKYSPAFRV